MATSKLNKEQYANIGSFAGIMLVYNSTNKDGELVQTAQHFFGADFEPADKSDNEIFRVIKTWSQLCGTPLRRKRNCVPMPTAYARNSVPQPCGNHHLREVGKSYQEVRPYRQRLGAYRSCADQSRPREVKP